jgi:tight adherence protein B
MISISPWMVAVVIMGAILVLFLLFRYLLTGRDSDLRRRLTGRTFDDAGVATASKGLAPASDSEIILHRPLIPKDETGREKLDNTFERMVVRSGLDMSPAQALALTALLGVIVFTTLYLWREQLWLATLGLLIGVLIPLLGFLYLQSRYKQRLQNQLPDALYVIARSLRAGMNLEQALDLVGEQGVKPLADEFRRASAQIRLGLTIPAALQSMAQRIQLLDFNSFVSIVTYYQSSGGNLPLLLDRLAASVRDRNQFRGQFFAVTAQARITAIFLGLFPFAILIGYALFEPDHIRPFFNSYDGWLMLLVTFALQFVGAVWVYRLLRIAY